MQQANSLSRLHKYQSSRSGSTRLESAETTLMNPDPCALGGVCGETDDAGEVKAKWGEASGISEGDEWYGGTDGLEMMRLSLGKCMWGQREV
jgi:hypothetical protein